MKVINIYIRNVVCYFRYSLSLFCLVMNTDIQGQKGKIRPWDTEERLCCVKDKRIKKKSQTPKSVKTALNICGKSNKICNKIKLAVM